MRNQKISIFVDGENFIRRVIENFFETNVFERQGAYMHHFFRMNFDFEGFFNSLIKEEYQDLQEIIWYDARLNQHFSDEHRGNQFEFFKKLRLSRIQLELGKTKGDPQKGEVKQKGVDTKLVTDLVTKAVLKKYDVAFLVSSDWDFLPAVNFIQGITTKPRIGVNYVFFQEGCTQVLHSGCAYRTKISWKHVRDYCSDDLRKYRSNEKAKK